MARGRTEEVAMYTVECPGCGAVLRSREDIAGRKVRCRHCNHVFRANRAPSPIVLDDTPRPIAPRGENQGGGGVAVASVVFGTLGMLAWIIPLFGLPITFTGFCLGIAGLQSPSRGAAVTGTALSALGLGLTLANSLLGLYLYMTGQFFQCPP